MLFCDRIAAEFFFAVLCAVCQRGHVLYVVRVFDLEPATACAYLRANRQQGLFVIDPATNCYLFIVGV